MGDWVYAYLGKKLRNGLPQSVLTHFGHIGRLSDDSSSQLCKLELHWRRYTFFHHDCFHPLQLQRSLRFAGVSAIVGCWSRPEGLTNMHGNSGLFVYTALNILIWLTRVLSRGRIEPRDYDLKEYWTWRPAGRKPWVMRAFTKGRTWGDQHERVPQHEPMMVDGDNDSTYPMHTRRMGSATSTEEKGLDAVSTPPRAVMRPE
jgi:hypothetical protein